jgi:DNA-directed RNA polymerase specialized sigma24 family protein
MDEEIEGQERVGDLLSRELRQNYRHVFGRLMALGRSRGLSRQDAQDLAGQTLLRALEKSDRYEGITGKPVLAWLTKLASNIFVDLMRARHREPVADAEELSPTNNIDQSALPDVQTLDAQAAMRRRALVARLSPEDRRFLRVWASQHGREIDRDEGANCLGMSITEYEAAKKRMKTVLARMLKELGLEPSELWSSEKHVKKIAHGTRKENNE